MRASMDPVRIARIGLVLELEDGAKVMVYADHLSHAEVVLTTETPTAAMPWGSHPRRFGPAETEIRITGLEAYRIQFTDPGASVSLAGRQLETFRREVKP